jgi:hypothetical protein
MLAKIEERMELSRMHLGVRHNVCFKKTVTHLLLYTVANV